ncbi:hypothetical protein OIU77_029682 [Salix suchowensis]|uniref:Uncharacterized protein n=3 Tax=Salix TaxID=40685 RepID=A0A9Q0T481_SALPP|nr:hypothetical protein OIU77_029682 [Salix suchowensis]KAJ6408341.1 hypothetical protein OIU84_011620 [Salix udensis]KAJ6700098.1 hypothetical protein OIU79_013191 [Salix purpurea]
MKRTNISSSKRTSKLISNNQASRNQSYESHPHHICNPYSHAPWHCHFSSLPLSLAFFPFLSLLRHQVHCCVFSFQGRKITPFQDQQPVV